MEYLHAEGRPKLDAELLYHAVGAAQLSSQELKALIGVSFRISLARMLFTSDVMTSSGNLVSTDTKLTRGTRLLPYLKGFLDVRDPLEGANRRTYIFNAGFDSNVLLPAVRGYQFITPKFVRTGIRNVFKTIDQATTFVNYVLQAKPKRAGQTLGRLGVNLTVGVLGLWDPATRMGIPEYQQNFGQTLARWGSGAGPYFVIPMLGPSSVRGATGTLVDRLPHILLGFPLLLAPVEAVDTRLHTPFRYRELGTPFEYDMVRFLSAEREKLLTLQ